MGRMEGLKDYGPDHISGYFRYITQPRAKDGFHPTWSEFQKGGATDRAFKSPNLLRDITNRNAIFRAMYLSDAVSKGSKGVKDNPSKTMVRYRA